METAGKYPDPKELELPKRGDSAHQSEALGNKGLVDAKGYVRSGELSPCPGAPCCWACQLVELPLTVHVFTSAETTARSMMTMGT